MQVARITLWDGQVFHTDNVDSEHIRRVFDRAAQVDLIEMTPEEYQAIPATSESARLFAS